jgi:hypothetical protein
VGGQVRFLSMWWSHFVFYICLIFLGLILAFGSGLAGHSNVVFWMFMGLTVFGFVQLWRLPPDR